MDTNIAGVFPADKIQQSYNADLESRISKVQKRANDAIKSFSDLVDEVARLQNDSKGTTAKEKVTSWASDVNNSTVMFSRMLEARVQALYGLVKEGEEAPIPS